MILRIVRTEVRFKFRMVGMSALTVERMVTKTSTKMWAVRSTTLPTRLEAIVETPPTIPTASMDKTFFPTVASALETSATS